MHSGIVFSVKKTSVVSRNLTKMRYQDVHDLEHQRYTNDASVGVGREHVTSYLRNHQPCLTLRRWIFVAEHWNFKSNSNQPETAVLITWPASFSLTPWTLLSISASLCLHHCLCSSIIIICLYSCHIPADRMVQDGRSCWWPWASATESALKGPAHVWPPREKLQRSAALPMIPL